MAGSATSGSVLRSLRHLNPPTKGSKFAIRAPSHAAHTPKFVQPKDRIPFWNIVPGDHVKLKSGRVGQQDGLDSDEKIRGEGIVVRIDREKNWLWLRDVDDKNKLAPKAIRHIIPRLVDPLAPEKGYGPQRHRDPASRTLLQRDAQASRFGPVCRAPLALRSKVRQAQGHVRLEAIRNHQGFRGKAARDGQGVRKGRSALALSAGQAQDSRLVHERPKYRRRRILGSMECPRIPCCCPSARASPRPSPSCAHKSSQTRGGSAMPKSRSKPDPLPPLTRSAPMPVSSRAASSRLHRSASHTSRDHPNAHKCRIRLG